MNLEQKIEDELVELIRLAETDLPRDVERALKKAAKEENTELGKMNLEIILQNVHLARKRGIPMCQDTGLLNFFIKLGAFEINQKKIHEILTKSVKRATFEIPLRPCVVNPLTRMNTNDNAGKGIPHYYLELIADDYMEITVLPKGAGSENMNRLFMLKPVDGMNGIRKIVLDTVIDSGGYPCPPIKIGVGMGGTSDLAMKLSKEALLRPCGKRHKNRKIANLENELQEMINSTAIGSMGLGGSVTTLDVSIEYADCHTASLPIGVSIQCWADRRATMRIYENGDVEFLTHRRIQS